MHTPSRHAYLPLVLVVTMLASALSAILAPEMALAAGSCRSGVVALTYDDGPTAYTPALLETLRREQVPAVLFMVGRRVDANPHMARFAHREGHQVLNHTWGHERLSEESSRGVRATIDRARASFSAAGVPNTKLMRPPYGALDSTARSALASIGYRPVLWTVSTVDWHPSKSTDQIVAAAVSGLRDGAVILMHDGPMDTAAGANTVEATPDIISAARRRGYCFGTLDSRGRVVRDSLTPRSTPIPRLTRDVPYLPTTFGPEPTVDALARFWDVPRSHTFHGNIEAMATSGVTRGCNPPLNTRYCSGGSVTRGQMAAFLTRALDLPVGRRVFADSKGHTFQQDIAALDRAGITRGCRSDDFCPNDDVTRGQMAAFLARALDLPPGSARFADTRGHTFEREISALARAGITYGCTPNRFCPDEPVTRAQMAAFLSRAGLL